MDVVSATGGVLPQPVWLYVEFPAPVLKSVPCEMCAGRGLDGQVHLQVDPDPVSGRPRVLLVDVFCMVCGGCGESEHEACGAGAHPGHVDDPGASFADLFFEDDQEDEGGGLRGGRDRCPSCGGQEWYPVQAWPTDADGDALGVGVVLRQPCGCTEERTRVVEPPQAEPAATVDASAEEVAAAFDPGPVPEDKAGQVRLLADAYRRWEHRGPVRVEVFPVDAWITMAALQLVMRHPTVGSSIKETIARVGHQLQDAVCDTAQMYALAELGWNPDHDVPDDAQGRPLFTCPKCAAVSHHPNDIAEGYCGACREWTGRPSPVQQAEAAGLGVGVAMAAELDRLEEHVGQAGAELARLRGIERDYERLRAALGAGGGAGAVPVSLVSVAGATDQARAVLADPGQRARVVDGVRAEGLLSRWLQEGVHLVDSATDGAEYRYVVTPVGGAVPAGPPKAEADLQRLRAALVEHVERWRRQAQDHGEYYNRLSLAEDLVAGRYEYGKAVVYDELARQVEGLLEPVVGGRS